MSSEWTKDRAMDILMACHDELDVEPKGFAREALAFLNTLLAETVSVQEAWEAAGGNPGIKATKAELLETLKLMDEADDEDDEHFPQPGSRVWQLSTRIGELTAQLTALTKPVAVADRIFCRCGDANTRRYCSDKDRCVIATPQGQTSG